MIYSALKLASIRARVALNIALGAGIVCFTLLV